MLIMHATEVSLGKVSDTNSNSAHELIFSTHFSETKRPKLRQLKSSKNKRHRICLVSTYLWSVSQEI